MIPPQRAADREYRATVPVAEVPRNPTGPARLASFHGSQARLPENNFSGGNYPRYRHPEWDGLLDTYFVTIPVRERNRILPEIIRHMTDQLNMMALFYDSVTMMVANRLSGDVTTRNVDSSEAWNIYDWDVR